MLFQVLRLKGVSNVIRDIALLGVFALITVTSYLILSLGCHFSLHITQCGERDRNALLLANTFFIGAPIFAFYLGVRIPMYIRRLFPEIVRCREPHATIGSTVG